MYYTQGLATARMNNFIVMHMSPSIDILQQEQKCRSGQDIYIHVHVTGDSSSKNVIACIIVYHHYIYYGSTVYIPMHHRWE